MDHTLVHIEGRREVWSAAGALHSVAGASECCSGTRRLFASPRAWECKGISTAARWLVKIGHKRLVPETITPGLSMKFRAG